MKINKVLFVVSLMIVMMSCLSTISASYNENMNLMSHADSISMNINEQSTEFDDYNNLLVSENNDASIESHDYHDLIGNDDENSNDDSDDNEDEDEDSDDDSDDNEDDNEDDDEDSDDDLDDDDIDEYFESFNSTNEYLNFIKYLIKEKGFKFNNHLEDEDGDIGYSLYATQTTTGKLYDGRTINIHRGYEYYIPINQRVGHVLNTYYPDIIYERFNKYLVDELYLGWLKWEENYTLSLDVPGEINNVLSTPSIEKFSDLPSSYDSRNVNGQNYVTSVKNQYDTNNCWAFASIAALESYLLKNERISYDFSDLDISDYDFSENNLKNVMSSLGEYGADYDVNDGNLLSMPLAYFIRWSGPVLEQQDQYIDDDVIEDYKAIKHVQKIKYISPRKNSKDNDEIKQAIYEYGSVVTSIYWNNSIFYEKDENYYFFSEPPKNATWHAICIVGWDDNYPKSNFRAQTENMEDGAFIVKNSYGSNVGDNGYYYISYYDTTLARSFTSTMGGATGFAFTSVENNTNFGKNYHYSPLGVNTWYNTKLSQAMYANQWTANSNETLTACGVYVNEAVNCSVYVLIDNHQIGNPTSIQLNYSGFHTINLNTPINITKGRTYKVAVLISSNNGTVSFPIEAPRYPYSKVSSNVNESFYFSNGIWEDLNPNGSNKLNFALHAYTEYRDLIPTKIEANDLSMIDGENKNIIATLFDVNNTRLKNFELTFIIDDEEHVVMTNDEGQASITINSNYNPGTYNVRIHFFGNDKYDDVRKTIKLIINQKKNVKKNVNINLNDVKIGNSIKVTLTSDGKSLKNKNITYKLGSKTYKNKKLKNGEFIINKKLVKNPLKITVIFKGDDNYNPRTKSAYVYQEIKKLKGLKKKVKYNGQLKLSLNTKKKLNVYFKLSKKIYKIKFNKNGEASFKIGKYNFKKGKIYNIKFYSKSKLYRVNVNHKLTIMKS